MLMAESLISRSLRDGSLEGEHAVALTIKDSLQSPLGPHAFDHFLSLLVSDVITTKSQSRGLVLVAFSRSPSFYLELLKSKGFDASSVRILDCYSDPLGWKRRMSAAGRGLEEKEFVNVFSYLEDFPKLFSMILDLGRGFVLEGKARFAVAIDSVSEILRHASLQAVAGLISSLRSHGQICSIFWLIHSDLHEARASAALEYISTMVASLEPMIKSADGHKSPENLFWLEQNLYKGKFHVRMKRRNGRVKVLCEDLHVDQDGVKFAAVSSDNDVVNQSLVPKVQFNLDLSEKEMVDRARVVLPFEHQGNGETIQIYDGRQSLSEGKKDIPLMQPSSMKMNESNCGKGEILYVRDSDDETPDSDEDPDDDLDI
ncbi:elongator complex protein 5 isoform X1 [Iris pallida]|uniref:Elongator complex protein 5 n=1 Tax=Iris pallida TaxID=29817 RepID=A0AAX6G1T6_IRIPA|nr:elongator complex protein 5 isoform X1 [Iris pallida]